jgi:hypothetical protein
MLEHTASRSCEQYNTMILTAGFKPSIKAKIMGANLTVLAQIKALALKTETLEGEKKNKPNGPNLQINPVSKSYQTETVDALFRYGGNRGNFNNRSYQGGSSHYRGNEQLKPTPKPKGRA